MPQLTKMASHKGLLARFFRWAYQANVMKTLEAVSSRIVCNVVGMIGRMVRVQGKIMPIFTPSRCSYVPPSCGCRDGFIQRLGDHATYGCPTEILRHSVRSARNVCPPYAGSGS